MRGQLGTLLPRQTHRRQPGNRAAALHYAAWDWPITPNAALPATADLEQVFAAWTRLPDAPILAACGTAFDVIEADAAAGRNALLRLDRLGVEVGPVIAAIRTDPTSRSSAAAHSANASGGAEERTGAARIRIPVSAHRRPGPPAAPVRLAFLVRPGTAATLGALLDPESGPRLVSAGGRYELPATLASATRSGSPEQGCTWLRQPCGAPPTLPTAHVILGALTRASSRAGLHQSPY